MPVYKKPLGSYCDKMHLQEFRSTKCRLAPHPTLKSWKNTHGCGRGKYFTAKFPRPRDLESKCSRDSWGILKMAGIYILYRDDVPHYIGQATPLFRRLYAHAYKPKTRYYNFWNFFSAFVVEDKERRNEIEAILIAAMPTANSAEPTLSREDLPQQIVDLLREIRVSHANPLPIKAADTSEDD